MSALKRIFSRSEWRFLGVSAVLAVALTLWFPFPSYFLVEAEVEQISVALDADSRLEWNLHQAELLPNEGPKALIDGQVSVRSKDIKAMSAFLIGKPLVIEEMFPLECSIDELDQFIDRSRSNCDGWVGFYWGKTEPGYRKDEATITNPLLAAWLKYFA